MCRLQNMALESVTDGQTDGQMDGQTTDKVIPMCRYASQATQQYYALKILYRESKIDHSRSHELPTSFCLFDKETTNVNI